MESIFKRECQVFVGFDEMVRRDVVDERGTIEKFLFLFCEVVVAIGNL